MKYDIKYENLRDELVTSKSSDWHFSNVVDSANKYKLELSEEDFKYLLQMETLDKDIGWVMHKMSVYKTTLTSALISYISYY